MRSNALLLRLLLAGGLFASLHQYEARAESPAPEIGIQEHLGRTLPREAELYDETGHLVSLGSLIDKPTIITFVYYRCPGICTPLLTELAKMVEKMSIEPGKEYQILTISFDPSDTPEMAGEKRENYLAMVRKKVNPAGWRFLTGDSATVRRLTDSAGFYYKRNGRDWVHAGTLIIVSPEAKITRYITGIQYLPLDITMAVYEASNGTVSPTISTVLRFCYSYDPVGRTYTLNVVRISLVVTLVLAGLFALLVLRKPKPKTVERQHPHAE
jgi:protein SCO1